MKSPELTATRLREALAYDARTGVFTWRASNARRRAGDKAGSICPAGYVRIGVSGRLYQAHRLVWLHVHGEFPPDEIDHLNGVRNDNRIVNLRCADRTINAQNRRKATTGSRSQKLGVSWNGRRNQWLVRIHANDETLHLGYFDDKDEAHAAYVAAKHKHHPGCSLPTFDALAKALTGW